MLAAAGSAVTAAALAPAKEGARARLAMPLPVEATAGTRVRVEWTVDVPDGKGGRTSFGASQMFVRLLGRVGARSTIAFTDTRGGRNVAEITVPAGGIGGIRVGLRGTTDITFPLDNDPFAVPGGARCDVATLRATLTTFVRAYNGGQRTALDRVFSRRHFVWYSSGEPGLRVNAEAANRATLLAYFARRHRRGDRLALLSVRFNGLDAGRRLGHFELTGRRRAADFRRGRWFRFVGKGALDCATAPVTIAVLSLGGPRR